MNGRRLRALPQERRGYGCTVVASCPDPCFYEIAYHHPQHGRVDLDACFDHASGFARRYGMKLPARGPDLMLQGRPVEAVRS